MCLIDAQSASAQSAQVGLSAILQQVDGGARAPEQGRDPGWRPWDTEGDVFIRAFSLTPVLWPRDSTRLYWWRAEYWLAPESHSPTSR